VLGELEFGILNGSPERRPGAAAKFDELLADCERLLPNRETISHYAHIRVAVPFPPSISRRREIHLLNDLWIAALCVQHRLPLLTNDRDFDGIEGLDVIHW
jgi:tRNA(fMet)-specific endonuclease VapC